MDEFLRYEVFHAFDEVFLIFFHDGFRLLHDDRLHIVHDRSEDSTRIGHDEVSESDDDHPFEKSVKYMPFPTTLHITKSFVDVIELLLWIWVLEHGREIKNYGACVVSVGAVRVSTYTRILVPASEAMRAMTMRILKSLRIDYF